MLKVEELYNDAKFQDGKQAIIFLKTIVIFTIEVFDQVQMSERPKNNSHNVQQ